MDALICTAQRIGILRLEQGEQAGRPRKIGRAQAPDRLTSRGEPVGHEDERLLEHRQIGRADVRYSALHDVPHYAAALSWTPWQWPYFA